MHMYIYLKYRSLQDHQDIQWLYFNFNFNLLVNSYLALYICFPMCVSITPAMIKHQLRCETRSLLLFVHHHLQYGFSFLLHGTNKGDCIRVRAIQTFLFHVFLMHAGLAPTSYAEATEQRGSCFPWAVYYLFHIYTEFRGKSNGL